MSAPLAHTAHPFADTQLHHGPAAAALLRNTAFRSEWEALYHSCPWATRFQHHDFSDAWWDVYAARHEPLIIASRDANGALRGLLLLAKRRQRGEIIPLGGHHAEYHTWLAAQADGELFMPAALNVLHSTLPARQLRFHFLAPHSPTAWTARYRGMSSPVAFLSPHSRGVRDLGDGSLDRAALRKKSTRSKLSRLSRDGDVRYLSVRTEAEFAQWLPQIRAQCDARHGSSGTPGPFAADSLKGDFYMRLMRTPGLAHCGVVVRDDQLLASHTGLLDGPSLGLGLITFDARESGNSPGKILLHMLCEELAASGYSTFDLTPGGSYKERFATRTDQVYSLDLRFTRLEALQAGVVRTARRTARRLLNTLAAFTARRQGQPRRSA